MIRISFYVLALIALAVIYFAAGRACDVRLTIINESGRTVSALRIATAEGKWEESRDLAASSSRQMAFSDFTAGSYLVHVAFADGEILSDTLGYVDPRAAFRDTLAIRTPSAAKPLALTQNTLPCREPLHLRSFLRRALRHIW